MNVNTTNASPAYDGPLNDLVDDRQRGLYGKYDVKRISDPAGKHDECRYFVLDPQHDPHAVTALRAYADACADEYPALATDLLEWIRGRR